ncbi:hypothetical protein ACFQX6_17910 [Streptosporangium lutulentum]
MTGDAPSNPLASRLGYLLKHAYLQLTEASAHALAPFGIDGRELAILAVLATESPLSQLEAAADSASTARRWWRSSTRWKARASSSATAVPRTGARTPCS